MKDLADYWLANSEIQNSQYIPVMFKITKVSLIFMIKLLFLNFGPMKKMSSESTKLIIQLIG